MGLFEELMILRAQETKSPAEKSKSGVIISIKWCFIPCCSSFVGFADTISRPL